MKLTVDSFTSHLAQLGLSEKKSDFLLALSGGVDSIVLLDLFHKAGYKGILAHVNYGLRGEASQNDEAFCRQLADRYKWPIKVLNAQDEMKSHPGESTQMAARRIRYNWFNAIRQSHSLDLLFTAHHANDQEETFFLQLLRGAGSQGLSGMDSQNNGLVRPLLGFSKNTILEYAADHSLQWTEDESNAQDHYLRNKIRHKLLPEWHQLQPGSGKKLQESISRLKNEQQQLNFFLQHWFNLHKEPAIAGFRIKKAAILDVPSPQNTLHELVKECGFSWAFCGLITQNLTQTHTQHFSTAKARIQLDRAYLSVFQNDALVFDELKQEEASILLEEFAEMPDIKGVNMKSEAWFSTQKLSGKLTLRKWEKGDEFWPSGMMGRKLLSDYFTDLKLTSEEKESQWLLCCGNDIAWLVNRRIDRRFAAIPGEKDVIRVRLSTGNE